MNDRKKLIDILYEGFYISPENDIKGTVQKHGRWIVEDDPFYLEGEHYRLVCSECGRIVFNINNPAKAIEYRPYCYYSPANKGHCYIQGGSDGNTQQH